MFFVFSKATSELQEAFYNRIGTTSGLLKDSWRSIKKMCAFRKALDKACIEPINKNINLIKQELEGEVFKAFFERLYKTC
jgi:hypothetical protein